MTDAALADVARHAVATEIDWPTDVSTMVAANDQPPHNRPIGPTKERGGAAGMATVAGETVVEWGDVDRVDMTFSATKSYLSTCIGLALDRGLITSVTDRVADYVSGDWFASEHNGAITWQHLLQQTSEWSGTLFGIPDSIDHNRSVARGEAGAGNKGEARLMHAPGTFWEYNDVRVNMLGFAGLQVWREPLPAVLKREIMDPIGASDTWEWHPYDNAWVDIDGESMPSVPGGGHWGGGLWISARDHARFGGLLCRGGECEGKQLISRAFLAEAMTPCPHQQSYGYMWWLNPGRAAFKNASDRAFAAQGAGGNVVCVVPEHELVVVTRWAANPADIVDRTIAAITA